MEINDHLIITAFGNFVLRSTITARCSHETIKAKKTKCYRDGYRTFVVVHNREIARLVRRDRVK